ncbi:MAG TPA: hypothetical protein VF006_13380 [Longimicrobium sp.]
MASALARYAAVADRLWGLLAGFTAPAGADPAVLANAAAAFAGQADLVARAWERRWPDLPIADAAPVAADAPTPVLSIAPPTRSFTYRARVARGDDLRALTLIAEGAPGPAGTWPDAFCEAPDGTLVWLVPGTPAGGVLVYDFPADPPILGGPWPRITLEWPELSVAGFQNARASIQVCRNRKLLGGAGPDTMDDFAYETSLVEAVDVVTPLNAWAEPVEITVPGGQVDDALSAALDALFGATTGLPLTIGMFYGYEVVPPAGDQPGLTTFFPVGLYPNQELSGDLAETVAAAVERWRVEHQPAQLRGQWAFSLALYSQVDPSAQRPLLTLDRLFSHILMGDATLPADDSSDAMSGL